jgi:hypothetical protein
LELLSYEQSSTNNIGRDIVPNVPDRCGEVRDLPSGDSRDVEDNVPPSLKGIKMCDRG